MDHTKPDHFVDLAPEWDKANERVQNARRIAEKIKRTFDLTGNEHIMDFGAGTGLLSEGLADHVQKITAIDYSEAMLVEFEKKSWPCETELIPIDLTVATLDFQFDGIISSMTMHHIDDVPSMISKMYNMLHPGGFIALGDLELEEGNFHKNNAGVQHFGFAPEYFTSLLKDHGFKNVEANRVNTIKKEVDGALKEFPVFLATGKK